LQRRLWRYVEAIQLAERFRAADDPEQVKQLGDKLGRFVFGK